MKKMKSNSGLLSKKWTSIGSITIGTLILLFQFQNCSPMNSEDLVVLHPEQRISDGWGSEKVELELDVIESLPTETHLTIAGACPNKGLSEPLNWQILDPSQTEPVFVGATNCNQGTFRIEFENLTEINCDTAYSLQVTNLDGEKDESALIKNCAH